MGEILIGAGEELGLFEQVNKGFVYGVRYKKETIALQQNMYKVWQLSKMGAYPKDEFAHILELPKEEIELYIEKLVNLELIIYWTKESARQIFSNYSLIPKGQLLKKGESDFIFEEIPKSQTNELFELPLIPTTIWRLANPYKNMEQLLNQLIEISGLSLQEVTESMLDWIPYLIGHGFLSIDKVR